MHSAISDPIIAQSTASGEAAIAVIRLSGDGVIDIVDAVFCGKNLSKVAGHTVHYGKIKNDKDLIIDECMASVFRAPRSYTRQDSLEISCHGSSYIIQQIIQLFLTKGVRLAQPGEFTMRAYLNGQLDLAQAEAVSDLISSQTASQHELAMKQMRGGFSNMIAKLRKDLIEFASLIELENDFGEEDVEFANRGQLIQTVTTTKSFINELIQSFQYGNAVKEGIPVAIIGRPNVGKSTLLNQLLNEEKAIVSDIAGTTRDVIEDSIQIDGHLFRFIDTAGLRETDDTIESLGIQRTKEQIEAAQIILYIDEIAEDHQEIIYRYKELELNKTNKTVILLLNKTDTFHACHSYDVEEAVSTLLGRIPVISFSAKKGTRLDAITKQLTKTVAKMHIGENSTITNLRHFEALSQTNESLNKVIYGLEEGISSDLVALDIRHALHHLGEITGEISTDDLLESIFSSFCIGK